MNLSVNEILNCTNGKLIFGDLNKECENFSRDTRTLKQGDTYLCIKGENFDGNNFWEEAFKSGADVVIANKLEINNETKEKYIKQGKTLIEVEDTIKALGKMATIKRNKYGNSIKVIAVTGSVGKTSTKDMIYSVISQKYKTLKTQGNKNNEIGLPFTILSLKDEEVCVIEMGMNHFGEITYLSKIAKPDIAVITNIGTSHIGNLGSRENILKAKLEILEGMENPILVLNNDNDLLHKWYLENKEQIEIHTFGIKNESEIKAENIDLRETESKFKFKNSKNEEIEILVPVAGEHFILNALSAIAVGKLLDLTDEQIKNGVVKFELTAKRMEIIKTKNNITVINDTYNASFESMKAGITNLANMNGKRKIVVLGDMFELGDYSEELHRKVGDEICKNNIDKTFLIGEDAKYIQEELILKGYNKEKILYFKNRTELIESLKNNLKEEDVVLFKASNGMKLFNIVEELIKYF